MNQEKLRHNGRLKGLAQQLRKNMTKEERKLWYNYLREHPLQFRRQVPFGQYILDFYCASAKLAVEIDGSQHFEPKQQLNDQLRTDYFESLGIKVIRFSNLDIQRNLQGVCDTIDSELRERTSPVFLLRKNPPSPKGRA